MNTPSQGDGSQGIGDEQPGTCNQQPGTCDCSAGDPSPITSDQSPEHWCLTCSKRCSDLSGFSSCCRTSLDFRCEPDGTPHPEFAHEFSGASEAKRHDPSRTVRENKKSQFRGVRAYRNSWRVQFRIKGQLIYLGQYKKESNAAEVFDNAVFYLDRAGFFDHRQAPELNTPLRYQNPSVRPGPFFRTTQLIARLNSAGK